MRMHSTDSAALSGFGYDLESRTLRLRFQSGEEYDYFKVPPDAVQALKAAQSKGRFFHDEIRDRYRYRRR